MQKMILHTKSIYRWTLWFLVVCSVWLTISVVVFFRIDFPFSFSHISILISFLVLILIFREKIKLPIPHAYLLCVFIFLFLLSLLKGFFIESETVTYINETFLTHYLYKKEDYPKFNSTFLYFKEVFHLAFAIITIFVSSLIVKKSNLSIDDFKYGLQKYLYYLVLFYLIIYSIFFIYEDIINIIGTNRYNGFRSFTSVRDQYFSKYFTYRLGITLSEPSFSGLYVLIFSPLIFLKSRYRSRLLILVPVFFLFNSSKYAVGVALIMILFWCCSLVVKILKSKKYFILFPIILLSFFVFSGIFIYSNWEKFAEILSGQSGHSRIFSMVSAINFFLNNLLTGIGIGQYPISFVNSFGGTSQIEDVLIRTPSAQSMFLNGLAEFGAVYILFILFIIFFLIKSHKKDKFLFYCSFILIFNLNASAGNGFNMLYYWVLLIFFSFYAWQNKIN